jgi:peroxiredoxin Q/BCP
MQFRDLLPAFTAKGARIVGVSRDSVESHQQFKEKYQLPFSLLADVDSKLCDAFGVIVDREVEGKTVRGIARSTFLFDPSGTVVEVWPKVSVPGHAEDVLSKVP